MSIKSGLQSKRSYMLEQVKIYWQCRSFKFFLKCIQIKFNPFASIICYYSLWQVVCKEVSASRCCSCLWLHIYMGWRSWSWALQCREVGAFPLFCHMISHSFQIRKKRSIWCLWILKKRSIWCLCYLLSCEYCYLNMADICN